MRYVFPCVNFVVIFLPFSCYIALAVTKRNTLARLFRDTTSKAFYQGIRRSVTFALRLTAQQSTHISDISRKSEKNTVNAVPGCFIVKVNTVFLCRQVSLTAMLTTASPSPPSDVWRSYEKEVFLGDFCV